MAVKIFAQTFERCMGAHFSYFSTQMTNQVRKKHSQRTVTDLRFLTQLSEEVSRQSEENVHQTGTEFKRQRTLHRPLQESKILPRTRISHQKSSPSIGISSVTLVGKVHRL